MTMVQRSLMIFLIIFLIGSAVFGKGAPPWKPQIWFSPQQAELDRFKCPRGSSDYMNLFAPDAPWKEAARHVQVFQMYQNSILHLTDEQLKQILDDLKRRNIALSLETATLALAESPGCKHIEGFGWQFVPGILQRVKNLGGTVDYLHLDVPTQYGIHNPENCITPEAMAQQIATHVSVAKAIFPNILVGDVEHRSSFTPKDYEAWIELYHHVTGAYLPMLILDYDYTRPNWAQEVAELEDFAHSRGIRFGFIYEGGIFGATTDREWMDDAEKVILDYEVLTGGRPDQVIFQSWDRNPHSVLPETNPQAFTHLINDYFRTRTSLVLSSGVPPLKGTLYALSDEPLPSAPIRISVKPIAGLGKVAQYQLTGIIPVCATEAALILRANNQCGECRGESDVRLYGVTYREEGREKTPLSDGNFALGIQHVKPSPTVRLLPSDEGPGTMLHLLVHSNEDAMVNLPSFPVTPGNRYTLTFTAKVSPISTGNGNFGLIFMKPNPGGNPPHLPMFRQILSFEPAEILTQDLTTDSEGQFSLNLDSIRDRPIKVRVYYPGNDRYWPAAREWVVKAR